MYLLFPLPKSPLPREGRVGPERWQDWFRICKKAASRGVQITPQEFESRSLITPACGLGPTTPEIADKVLPILAETGKTLGN